WMPLRCMGGGVRLAWFKSLAVLANTAWPGLHTHSCFPKLDGLHRNPEAAIAAAVANPAPVHSVEPFVAQASTERLALIHFTGFWGPDRQPAEPGDCMEPSEISLE